MASPEVDIDLQAFFDIQYAHALDNLFETNWYITRGFSALNEDPKLREFVVQCMEEMRSHAHKKASPPALASLEARMIWSLAMMPRTQHMYGAHDASSNSLVLELLPRLETVEHLLTGRYMDPSRLPSPPATVLDNTIEASTKSSQQAFWYHLGRFTTLRDDQGDAQTLEQVASELSNIRLVLNVIEHRDVLYSIAVARHLGGRIIDWNPQNPQQLPMTNYSDDDDVSKLNVAHGFLQTEEQRGADKVVRRMCSMSLRAWSLQPRGQ